MEYVEFCRLEYIDSAESFINSKNQIPISVGTHPRGKEVTNVGNNIR